MIRQCLHELLAALVAMIAAVAFNGNQALGALSLQKMQDLCTLSAYMSGQSYQIGGWTVIDHLLESEEYPRGSQKRYSYLDKVEVLSEVKRGKIFTEALFHFFDQVIISSARQPCELCSLPNMAEAGWHRQQMSGATWDVIFPNIAKRYLPIKKKGLRSIKDLSYLAVRDYVEQSWKFQHTEAYRIASHAPKTLSEKLVQGATLADEGVIAEQFKLLFLVEDRAKNPLFWESDYFTGWTWPISPLPWKLHTVANDIVRDTYFTGLRHIQQGSFQRWWEDEACATWM